MAKNRDFDMAELLRCASRSEYRKRADRRQRRNPDAGFWFAALTLAAMLSVSSPVAFASEGGLPPFTPSTGDSAAVADPTRDGFSAYLQGNMLLMAGKFREAIRWFRRSADFDSTEAGPAAGIARCYTELEQPDSAELWVERAIRLEPDDPALYRISGMNLSRLGRGDQAVRAFQRSLELDPEDLSTRMSLLALYDGLRRPEEALRLIDESPEEIQQLTSVRARRARILVQLDRVSEAIPGLLVVLKTERDFPDAEALLLMALSRAPLTDTLQAAVDSLLAARPGMDRVRIGYSRILLAGDSWPRAESHLKLLARSRPRDPSVQKLWGMFYLRQGKAEQAADRFREAGEISPDDPEPLRWLCRLASIQKNPGEALRIATRIQARAPGDRDGLLCQAFALTDLRRPEEAISVLESLLGQDPGDREAGLLQALLLAEKAKFGPAAQTLRGVLAIHPEDREVAFRLGSVFEEAGEADSAMVVFDQLIRDDPNDPLVLNYAGYLCIDRGIRLEEAVEWVRRALEADPENGAFLDSYGWGLYRLGRPGEAEEYLRRAVSQSPKEPVIHLHLGQVLAALGRTDEARKAYKKAADLDPKDPEVQKLLQALETRAGEQPAR